VKDSISSYQTISDALDPLDHSTHKANTLDMNAEMTGNLNSRASDDSSGYEDASSFFSSNCNNIAIRL